LAWCVAAGEEGEEAEGGVMSAKTSLSYYVLCDDGRDHVDWPTVVCPDGEAVVLFTTKEKALSFRDTEPRLARYPILRLVGDCLLDMLRDCTLCGIAYVACDAEGDHTCYNLISKFLSQAEGD
jgi:hypothetical protein